MRLEQKLLIERPPKDVFALVGEPSRYPEFLTSITSWKPMSDHQHGVGARFRVLTKVGAVEVGGVVSVDRWDEEEKISWSAEQGVHQSGSWTLTPLDGGTELALVIEYDIGGGLVGRLVERIAARTLARKMWATLLAARRIVENDG
jgi:ribosome-associated toxin RatA of RatAB toxin-antitoxin module